MHREDCIWSKVSGKHPCGKKIVIVWKIKKGFNYVCTKCDEKIGIAQLIGVCFHDGHEPI